MLLQLTSLLSVFIFSNTCDATALRHASGLASGDPDPYDPVLLLCSLGKKKDGSRNIQGWCKDWLSCIKEKAVAKGSDAAAVKEAWGPADCKEYCGEWPAMTEFVLHLSNKSLASTTKGCQRSCKNFQESLSECVATVLFKKGQFATHDLVPNDVPAHCTEKDTPCLPHLKLKYQKCVAETCSDIEKLKSEVDKCSECPNFGDQGTMKFQAYIGGCMDQLNAYHQATHPDAGPARLPGATGCQVH